MKKLFSCFLFALVIACGSGTKTQFELKDNAQIGISFENNLSYSDDFNVYKYRNYYNGGGVALGDINNDGWVDVYFTSNQGENKLYLNQGDFSFKDITTSAGVAGQRAWSTGVAMVDINADGWLDIYVCNSGDIAGDKKENELFINQGDGTFVESAEAYNLADKGFSTHATFFDYDKDGDLDVYILNNSYQAIGSFDLRRNERPKRDLLGGDKLMENRDGKFYDVSEAAGIYGSVIGFGLGVTVGDINRDGWDDLFISNDFFERDYLYINQQDGTFKEVLPEQMRSISGASMGADLADLDNDGFHDLFVTEMLPSNYNRLKSVTTFEDWNKYQYNVKNGYGHQFTRNMLHRNNTNGTFSEVGRLAGVEASDWSWGALFFDMDNDGLRDLFVANGIYQDLTDQDYLQYVSSEEVIQSVVSGKKVDYKRLIDIIPSEKVPNHSYLNQGDFSFDFYTDSGLNQASFSNGSAYGDLDNDGDLDLVVNNVNMPAFVYENKLDPVTSNALQIQLEGAGDNTQALGAKLRVLANDQVYYAEHYPIRGFQSSMDPKLHLGLGQAQTATVEVIWPTGGMSRVENVSLNTPLVLKEEAKQGNAISFDFSKDAAQFNAAQSPNYTHKENNFVDFHRERLTYHMCSNEGPVSSQGDINNDGYPDFIIPGAKNSAGQILLGSAQGWVASDLSQEVFEQIKGAEHTETLLFDADNDNDLDLYLVSGGIEVTPYSQMVFDHLLFNDGKGNFTLSEQKLPNPNHRISSGAVRAADVDQDGDLDLFVGERLKYNAYGLPASGYLLINDGKGNFSDQTPQLAREFINLGMITDAQFLDMDSDNDPDLLVVGEFTGIHLFENQQGKFVEKLQPLAEEKGWWLRAHAVDIDQDGDQDFVLGNHGKNSRFRTSKERPVKMYLNDFDQNGSIEGVLTFTAEDGRDLPYALRHDLIDQMKVLKKKFPDYASFRNADITTIFDEQQRATALIQTANNFASAVLINQGDFNFTLKNLPQEAQLSPVYAIESADVDGDGDQDLFLGGNLFKAKPEVGIYDASYGTYLENTGDGNFRSFKDGKGFSVKGEVRDIKAIDKTLLVFRNNDSIATFKF